MTELSVIPTNPPQPACPLIPEWIHAILSLTLPLEKLACLGPCGAESVGPSMRGRFPEREDAHRTKGTYV